MNAINTVSKIVCVTLVVGAAVSAISYADPGNMEAINSASSDLRNIIGVEISTATPAQTAAAGFKDSEGAFISAVIPKQPAETAGLKAGDIIAKIDGNRVTDHSRALELMAGLDAGREYPFEIYRRDPTGASQKITVNVLVRKVQEKAIGKIS
ncbi:MAG: PDZ domain-containing protein [Alphaproteobacteria bacterium]|jgi:S1-C subfamily serine protease|nr:PDZ domain-containing protein [Alphaproteobacteria bacterium]